MQPNPWSSSTSEAIPIRVRLFEFLQPIAVEDRLEGERLYPDLEVLYNIARPMMELYDRGTITVADFDRAALHELRTEVLVLAGRWDHTVDYRCAIALAASYPKGLLFIADDDHMFGRLKEGDRFHHLVQAFLGSGLRGDELGDALQQVEADRWRE